MLVSYIKQECCQILIQQLTKWYYSVRSHKRLNEHREKHLKNNIQETALAIL
jgi:hypothetical protein